MSWNLSISGSKEEAKVSAPAQADSHIAAGNQTEEQKVAALALIDAAPGTHVSGNIGGHNNANNAGGSLNISVTCWTATAG
jgi:hypothetical protein